MKHTPLSLLITAMIVFGISMSCAYADSPWKSRAGGLRSRSASFHGGRSSLRPKRPSRLGSSSLSGRSSSRSSSGITNLSRGLSQLNGRSRSGQSAGSGIGNGGILQELLRGTDGFSQNGGYGDLFNGSYGNRYHREDPMAKAYRDVGIANAVVGLIGVLVTASQYSTPPAAVAAPVRAVPAGHWERQTVVVQPKHYENYQEWIPEIFDSRTGQKIGGGFYETRTRLVPETLQHRDVWVGP
ncbi:MAG: hypothetical protein KAH38_11355 [Candidatus Hydrogenedentes bacterium]|nr:hypothetical protein [Candidatus Hydrogenedentota bacterium]